MIFIRAGRLTDIQVKGIHRRDNKLSSPFHERNLKGKTKKYRALQAICVNLIMEFGWVAVGRQCGTTAL